jgi:cell division protein FtsA
MIGVRLEAEIHIITCSVTSAENLIKCVNRAGFAVKDLILQSLAAGRAVLTEEEKELGVALIDLGGGTTEMLVYSGGAPYSTITIPAGGVQVTGDIQSLTHISFEAAENIKVKSGCCWEGLFDDEGDILVPGVGGRSPLSIPRAQILTIIKPRMEELFKMLKEKLDKLALSRPLGGGIVLTGGGAQLLGAAELASHIFKLPVRVGLPLPVGAMAGEIRNPAYAAALGLVLEGNEREGAGGTGPAPRPEKDILTRLSEWLRKEFF